MLSDDRKESYREIIAMSTEPQSVELAKPESRDEPTKARENDKDFLLPTWKRHLLCDKNGNYPLYLNNWERAVVESESKRVGFQFWYRNPQQPGQSSLGIAYQVDEQFMILRPDFIFFSEQEGKIVVDLVDPHSLHLADALEKLRGLATYATVHTDAYRRIESIAEIRGQLRALDLKREDVRQAIKIASGARGLFDSTLAHDYI